MTIAEQTEIVTTVRDWVDREVVPVASELEHADEFPAGLVTQMKELTDSRGVRFWVALPLTSPATQIAFWKDSAVRTGVSLISPSPQSQQEWYARCGGTLTFRIDGHYSACGHAGQAEVLTAALRGH